MVHLQDYNDPPPSRKPWIILGVAALALVTGIVVWRHRMRPSTPSAPVARAVPAAPVVQPAPAVRALPSPAPVAAPVAAPVSAPAALPTAPASNAAPAVAAGPIPASALEEAEAMIKAGRLVEARDHYLAILERNPGAEGIAAVEEKAGALGIELVMKPHPMPEKTEYVVAGGDTIDKIARKFGTTRELLITNNLVAKPSLIKKGDRFRVFSGKFSLRVNKTRHDMVVFLNGRFFKRYLIGTGKFGKTPVGTFVVVDRIAQPVWWKPDGKAVPFGHPENILGTHWLALKPTGSTPAVSGYGIHGTWDEASIGKSESAGCVRMRNAEVQQLFTLLPNGTEVAIEE